MHTSTTGPLVLTIDVGSSSIRTNLFTVDAVRLPGFEAQLTCPLRTRPDGGVEIDPHALLGCVSTTLDETLARAQDAGVAQAVVGVGMCSLVSNVLGLDKDGLPTTPIYTWADTRCASEAAELRATFNEAEVTQRTGCPIHTSYLPARLLWLRRTAPEAYERTAQWITLGDWLYLNLFGNYAQSLSVASWNGLLNRYTLDWDDEWMRVLGLEREHLPLLADAYDAFTGLREEHVERWPELRDVPWYPCLGDGATSNLGSGCYTPEAVAIQVGTSSAVRALMPGTPPAIPGGLWCYRLDRDTALLGGALSEGGNVLDWLRSTLGIDDVAALERDAAQMAPNSHGLTVLPFIVGERSLGWRGDARATIAGLSASTRPAHIWRAAQEAVTYRLALVYERLCSALPPVDLSVASGGALLGVEGWVQMLADVLGRPITVSGEPEASSKGSALVALRALGAISHFSQIPPALAETCAPNMERHMVYKAAMEQQQDLYERTSAATR